MKRPGAPVLTREVISDYGRSMLFGWPNKVDSGGYTIMFIYGRGYV